jgi:uncharacterized membrane protein
MIFTQWVVGPQLIGLIILIVGYAMKRFPPKRINSLYGYRTAASMKNQQTWDEANNYSAKLMIKAGLVAILPGLIMAALIPIKYEFVMAIAAILAVIGITITLLVCTEKHLKKIFDDKTE